MEDGKNPRILVVDDDPDVRKILTEMLRGLGFESRAAVDGVDALEQARQEPPDAVLLDISMPEMDGLEVCRHLRSEAATAAVPILLLTGHDEAGMRVDGFEAGADDFVSKPFDVGEVATRLRSRLDLQATRAELAGIRGVMATIRLVSHEFNNPLQAVVGGLYLLERAKEDDASISEEEAVQMITAGAKKMADLARRLIQISEPAFKDTALGPMLDMDASR